MVSLEKAIAIAAVPLIGLTIFRPFVVVQPGTVAVSRMAGTVNEKELEPGVHFIVPFLTKLTRYSTQVQSNDFDAAAGSRDLQQVGLKLTVNWQIDPTEANTIYTRVGGLNNLLSSLISPAIQEQGKAAAATLTAEEMLTKRQLLKEAIERSLRERLAPFGINVLSVSVANIDFSDSFDQAIEAKTVAQQNALKAQADAETARQQGLAEVARAKGQAEAQRLRNGTLTPQALQQMAIEKWDGHLPQVSGGATPFVSIPTPNPSPSPSLAP